MRIPLLTLVLISSPILAAAQQASVGPALSVLFAPATRGTLDTTGRRSGPSIITGGGIGASVGILLGAAFGSYMAAHHPCTCDDPGLEPFSYGFLGGVIGFVVGASMADEHRQEEEAAVALGPRVPQGAVTENGTPLTADTTRLVGRDPHGVRGGIAGALIGGAMGYGVTHGIYSLQHSGPRPDSGEGGEDGPSALALGVGTATGAISGYLIAAMLSRR